jgi:hypothetical protein
MIDAEGILSKLNLAERDVCIGLELIIRSYCQLDLAEESLIRAKNAIAEAKELVVEAQKLTLEAKKR